MTDSNDPNALLDRDGRLTVRYFDLVNVWGTIAFVALLVSQWLGGR